MDSNEMDDALTKSYEKLKELNQYQVKENQRRFEAGIKAALEKHGFNFDTKEDFYEFLKERSRVVTTPEGVSTLFVDDATQICYWIDKTSLNNDGINFQSTFTRKIYTL
jgi:hypothetical protein